MEFGLCLVIPKLPLMCWPKHSLKLTDLCPTRTCIYQPLILLSCLFWFKSSTLGKKQKTCFKTQTQQFAPSKETTHHNICSQFFFPIKRSSQQFALRQPPAGLCSGLKPSSILFLVFFNLNTFPEKVNLHV